MATQKTVEHKTPNGGVKSTIYYQDKEGNPADEEVAIASEIVEFDKDGKEIFRTYGGRD